MKEPTLEMFLKDVSHHRMVIERDSGVYRVIRFHSNRVQWSNWFTIVTWKECLSITGDMGSYTFSRIEDMFNFFRSNGELEINPPYWAEKCLSVDKNCGLEVYDEDRFKNAVKEHFDQHEFPNEEYKKECWEEIREQVLCADHEYQAHQLASQFKFTKKGYNFEFSDFWERRLKSYSYQYLWCLWAIVWGIQQYDLHTSAKPKLVPTEGGLNVSEAGDVEVGTKISS